MQPLVSIIIPTYNRASLLKDTIDSVMSQTYDNWECIIVDDSSTDSTKELVNEFVINDSRFLFTTKPDGIVKGASSSRNLGLQLSKGEYIQFLDSDDILAPNKIEKQIAVLSGESNFTISTCKWGKFTQLTDPINLFENNHDYKRFSHSKEYFDLIGLHGGFFPCHSFLIHKELINLSGYWNENLTINDDGEFFFRVVLNCDQIIFEPETYVLYRQNISNDNLSSLKTVDKALSLVDSWKIIEALYHAKYKDFNSAFLNKKKLSVYFEIKRTFPEIISKNKTFFKQQIKNDTFALKLMKLKKRVFHRLKIIFNK
ncbi:glycosyltransferase family 2 protein [Flavobacterium sp. C3NV]|uniref:glycosyltransferase family 2 protein n=1 Tax=Flavobacterium sp. C3NV TaxID=3393358 RepID=UPI00398FB274